jgi:hypothetical protein
MGGSDDGHALVGEPEAPGLLTGDACHDEGVAMASCHVLHTRTQAAAPATGCRGTNSDTATSSMATGTAGATKQSRSLQRRLLGLDMYQPCFAGSHVIWTNVEELPHDVLEGALRVLVRLRMLAGECEACARRRPVVLNGVRVRVPSTEAGADMTMPSLRASLQRTLRGHAGSARHGPQAWGGTESSGCHLCLAPHCTSTVTVESSVPVDAGGSRLNDGGARPDGCQGVWQARCDLLDAWQRCQLDFRSTSQ